jgi:methylenetetrahydrofolate reductase (NADPH)
MDIEYLKRKVECGADYIVTQMFFDNSKYFSFVDKCRAAGITVPIIPGIKPISTQRHIELLPQAFSIDIPQELMKELLRCKSSEAIYRLGIEWAVLQCKELLESGARAVHFYTMGKADNIREIIRRAF